MPPARTTASPGETNKAPNSTLRTQGRCFKCRKKGHIAKNCKTKRNPNARLQNLPVELLELVCSHVTEYEEYEMSFTVIRMFSLRMTCRAIYDRTIHYFGRIAFGTTVVRLSYAGLLRLNNISQHPIFAAQIRRILISEHNYNAASTSHKFLEMQETLRSDSMAPNRRQIRRDLYRARAEQADKAFIERSATDGIMLVTAFQRLSNLKDMIMSSVDIKEDRMPIRRAQDGEGPFAGRIFSMLLSSLAHAHVKLETFRISHRLSFDHQEGIPVSALSMPRPVLDCLSGLHKLHLLLEAGRKSYEGHEKWTRYAAKFIARCTKLRELSLTFRTWDDTEAVFSSISKSIQLPDLQKLRLNGIRCRGEDLVELLRSHPGISELTLKNLDVTGDVSIKFTLTMIKDTHSRLKLFDANQIAQNSRRVFLRSLGLISCTTSYTSSDGEPDDFSEYDFVNISKYDWRAEEWQGVQESIGLMSEDLVVSRRLFHSDWDLGDTNYYTWID